VIGIHLFPDGLILFGGEDLRSLFDNVGQSDSRWWSH
jgi:hypothetical protein